MILNQTDQFWRLRLNSENPMPIYGGTALKLYSLTK
jgi:hypothetical protein